MKHLVTLTQEHIMVILLCLANLFLSFHYFLTIYINSSFLSKLLFSNQNFVVTFLYSVASLVTCLFFLFATHFLTRLGAYRLSLIITTIDLLAVNILSLTHNLALVLPFLFLHLTSIPLIFFLFDIFLEHFSPRLHTTGSTRGVFLTVGNIALVLSPFFISLLGIAQNDFSYIYKLSGLFLFPLLFIFLFSFRNFKDPVYPHSSVHGELYRMLRNKNIRGAVFANFILQIFFSVMVIYLPLYLIDTIGFSWSEFGLILSIALLPFALFELPIGLLADRKYGEREMMSLGFVVLAVAVTLLSFISVKSLAIFATVLFATRVGAALIETTSESYFFKKTEDADADLTGIFRMTRPVSYLIGPLLGLPIVLFFSYHYLFIAVGLIMLTGLYFSFSIEDTR
jgi:MFS family permease